MNMKYPKKFSAHISQRRLKELFIIANLQATSPQTKAKVKLAYVSIQHRQDLAP